MDDLSGLIDALPKAELHIHIEGSLEPELMFALAARNNIALPFDSVEAVRAAYDFSNLQDFLDIYYQGACVLVTEDDFYDLMSAYFARATTDNVRHAEIMFDPQTHLDRGIAFDSFMKGFVRAQEDARAKWGISSYIIMCFLRHLSEEAAIDTLDMARPWLSHITAVGLDSSEVGHPPAKFARVFKAARDLGLRLTAHAGEEGPPDYVCEALDLLHIDRIDHGNRCLEDESLVARIAAKGLTLTVCPLSNHKLCVVRDLKAHPIPTMLQKGLMATINSDDPAYFGGYVNDNYKALARLGLISQADCITLARNSINGSFLPQADKKKILDEIDAA